MKTLYFGAKPRELSTKRLAQVNFPRRSTRCDSAKVVCFVGTLVDIMRTGGKTDAEKQSPSSTGFFSWHLGFFSDDTPYNNKSALRRSRAQTLKSLLSLSRGEKPIKLPLSVTSDAPSALTSSSSLADKREQQQQIYDDADDEQNYISNAVPFSQNNYTSRAQSTIMPSPIPATEAPSYQPRPDADQLFVVLPWLFAAPGQLEHKAVEYIASQLALSRVHLLDFSRLLGSVGPSIPWLLGDGIAWVGATPLPSPTIATAAALHRLSHRCGGVLSPPPGIGGSAVLLSYRQEEKEKVAEALAIYFHLYGGMEAKDAASAAGDTLRCPAPLLSVLDAGVQEMACCGKGWLQRVVLEWHYAGGRVEATGNAVGGWDRFVPLTFDVRYRKWKVQVWGLAPGVSTYKFIVDGRWCSDVAAPSQIDAFGNTNNVVVVPGCAASRAGLAEMDAGDGMAAALMMDEKASEDVEGVAEHSLQRYHRMSLRVPEENDFLDKSTQGSSSPVSGGMQNSSGEMKNRIHLEEPRLEEKNAEDSLSPEERLRLARFGAGVLAYYAKSAVVHRSLPVRF